MTSFRLLRQRGTAPELFAAWSDPADFDGVPTVVDRRVTRPALVLGSTQSESIVSRHAPAAVDVVRRRSGGGAVLVEPDGVVWLDVFVPAGHPLWDADVGRAFWWLGDAWARALAAMGVSGQIEVHKGPLVTTPWSRLVCFAGLGPGEVTVDGRKTVGIAQRRTSEGALFQCALALTWAPERLLPLFDPSLTQSEHPLPLSEHPLAQSDQSPAQSEHPLTQSDQSLEQSEHPLSEHPLASSEQGLAPSDQSLPQSEQPLETSERSLEQSDQSLARSEQSLAQSEHSLTSSEHPFAQSERSLEQPERPLAQSERSLEQSDQSLAQSERLLTQSGRSLASSERTVETSEQVLGQWERALAALSGIVRPVGPLAADECTAALVEQLP